MRETRIVLILVLCAGALLALKHHDIMFAVCWLFAAILVLIITDKYE